MAGGEDTCALLVQGLSTDISRDALELHIEEMTDVGVVDVEYRNKNTEAIVKLEETIKFDSEIPRTISGRDVKIVIMKGVPVYKPRDTTKETDKKKLLTEHEAYAYSSNTEHRHLKKPNIPIARESSEDVPCEKPPVVIQGYEGIPQEKSKGVSDPKIQSPPCTSPKDNTIKGVVKVNAMKHDLLKMLLPDFQSSYPNCSLKIVTEGIELYGASEAVMQAKLEISEKVFTFKSIVVGDSERSRLLLSDKSQQKVQELFMKAGIQAVLSSRQDQPWLTAISSNQISQASRILNKNTHRCEIPVNDFHQEFLHSADCKQFIEDLEHKYAVSIEKGTSTLVIEVLGDCLEEMKKHVEDKLKDNIQHSDDIPLTDEQWKLLTKYYQTEVETYGQNSAGTRPIKVTLMRQGSGSCVIQMIGDPKQLQDVKTKLTTLVQGIVQKKVLYNIPDLHSHMCDREGAKSISSIQDSCKCLITVAVGKPEKRNEETKGDGDMEEDGAMVEETKEDPRRWSGARNNKDDTASKVMLEVKQGDITTFQAGVLVNTPVGHNSSDLSKCGHISKTFCNVGGPQLQMLYGTASAKADGVTVTAACGNLKSKHVFHMQLRSLRRYSYQQLEDQIYKCLQKASELQADSIVFPTVGCGRLHYDPSKVVQCFKLAVQKHASDASCCISKVIIAAYGKGSYQQFEQLLSGLVSPLQRTANHERPIHPVQRRGERSSSHQKCSSTLFHITTIGHISFENAAKKIKDSIMAYSAEETVQAQHLETFTKEELKGIMSLSTDKVRIFIDEKHQKCFHLIGAKQSLKTVATAVQQKVQETEGTEEFKMRLENKFSGFTVPQHWKLVKNLSDRPGTVRVGNDIDNAIRDLVQQTWVHDIVGVGYDAQGLAHEAIKVTEVVQIENGDMLAAYEQKQSIFLRRATKTKFHKVTDVKELDVLTSTLGITNLDKQLTSGINEYFLFHGAKQDCIEAIVAQGIDSRLSGTGMFGTGSYFCENSTKADQYADPKDSRTKGPHNMFLCKVILGCSYIANKPDNNMKRPPCLHNCKQPCKHGASEFFDSVVGIGRNDASRLLFREFIIYDKCQSYPAYLITYERV